MPLSLSVYIREIQDKQIKVQSFDCANLINFCETLKGHKEYYKIPIYGNMKYPKNNGITFYLKCKCLQSVISYENDSAKLSNINDLIGLEATVNITIRKYSFKSRYLGNTGETVQGIYFILNKLKILI